MSDNQNAPAEAGGELTGQISPAASKAPLSVSAAARMWAEANKTPEEPAAAAPGDDVEPVNTPSEEVPASDDGGEASETEETASEDDAEPPAEAAETDTDAEPEEDQLAHGNMRTRLRDGTVTTVGELKKLADEAREYRAKASEFSAKEQQFQQIQQHAAQLEQQQQLVQQVWPAVEQALTMVQAQITSEPDIAMLDPNSPIFNQDEYLRMKMLRAHNLQQHQQLMQALEARTQQAREAEVQQIKDRNRQVLLKQLPEFSSPEGEKAVHQRIAAAASRHGITQEEVENNLLLFDPRITKWLDEDSRDAAAYRKLKSQKPAPAVAAKSRAAAPVQQPGRRAPAGEIQQQQLNERLQQWRSRGGSKEEAIALWAALNK